MLLAVSLAAGRIPIMIERFQEASTWRGIIAILTALGVTLEPDQVAAIVSAGMGLAGLIGVFTSDKKS